MSQYCRVVSETEPNDKDIVAVSQLCTYFKRKVNAKDKWYLKVVVVAVGVLNSAQEGLAIYTALFIQSVLLRDDAGSSLTKVFVIIGSALTATVNIPSVAVMSYLLVRVRGGTSSLWSAVVLVVFLLRQSTEFFSVLYGVGSGVYASSLLYSLNIRRGLSGGEEDSGDVAPPMSPGSAPIELSMISVRFQTTSEDLTDTTSFPKVRVSNPDRALNELTSVKPEHSQGERYSPSCPENRPS
ncbi:hypothetical protein C8Q79DRAFT_1011493 [Trametes meyenii]|nr:hypothetical protein C8Q79DRAFT_1011493 [Trametes meyenii]